MPGASGIEVVWAAMMAPVSSKLQSLRVMAARMIVGLELERDGERAHPVEPIVAGALEELARGGIDGRLEGLVRSQDQGDRLDQRERRLVRDVGEGAIAWSGAARRRRRSSGCGWSRWRDDAQGPP